jgi:hypothetical protein
MLVKWMRIGESNISLSGIPVLQAQLVIRTYGLERRRKRLEILRDSKPTTQPLRKDSEHTSLTLRLLTEGVQAYIVIGNRGHLQ